MRCRQIYLVMAPLCNHNIILLSILNKKLSAFSIRLEILTSAWKQFGHLVPALLLGRATVFKCSSHGFLYLRCKFNSSLVKRMGKMPDSISNVFKILMSVKQNARIATCGRSLTIMFSMMVLNSAKWDSSSS